MSLYHKVLNSIYDTPAGVTIIRGRWKTGKTDFALMLYEHLRKTGLVNKGAGNVQLFEDPECNTPSTKDMEYIDNFAMLKAWMFKDTHRKLFIYDEAMKNAPSKKAMTILNSEWQRVIPELSKGKVQLFAITQEESMTEKIFGHPTFCVARWEKIDVSHKNPQYRKMVKVSSKGLKDKLFFRNITPTSLYFNPYRSAEWTMEPKNLNIKDLSIDLQIAFAYAEGQSTYEIQRTFDLRERTTVVRSIRKVLKSYQKSYNVAEAARVVGHIQTSAVTNPV